MKRVSLFLATNIAVLLLLSVVIQVFGLNRWLSENGIDYAGLLVFSAVIGFGGSFISLLISKWAAKRSTGARVIDGTEGTSAFSSTRQSSVLNAVSGQGTSSRCW